MGFAMGPPTFGPGTTSPVVAQALPNTEPKLRELFAKLKARHGTVLVVVDPPASVRALPLAVLPGLTLRRIADLCPGEAKTDASAKLAGGA